MEQKLPLADVLDSSPVGPTHLKVLILCMLVAIFDGFDVQSISFAAPLIGKEWGAPREAFGYIFSAGIVGMLVGLIIQGPCSDRLGRKPMILFALLTFGTLSLFTSAATSLTHLMILRFLTGIGMGAAVPNILALTREYAPAKARSLMIVCMNAGLPAGGLLGGIASSYLLQEHGWRSIFIVGGIGPLALAVAVVCLLPESIPFLAQRAARRPGVGGNKDLGRAMGLLNRLRNDNAALRVDAIDWSPPSHAKAGIAGVVAEGRGVGTILIWLVFTLNMVTYYFLVSWLPSILTGAGIAPHLAALSSAMTNLGAIIGGLLLGWVSDRSGLVRTLAINYVLSGIFFVLLSLSLGGKLIIISLVCVVLGFTTGGAQLILNVLAANFYPTAVRSTGIGMAGIAGRIGAIAGPAVGSVLVAAGASASV
jgi:AAHS family 4-hydroxybenzoate transporter-like MFS transporter